MQECVEQHDKRIYYTKLHVPWETLSVFADYLSLRAPLQVDITYHTRRRSKYSAQRSHKPEL